MIKFYQSRFDSYSEYIPILEDQFAKYTGFKYAIAVDSCTNGIALCLEYEKPAEVRIPAMTYVSVANEILHAGAKLQLVDACWAGIACPLAGTLTLDSAHEITHRSSVKWWTRVCYSFYPTKLVPSYEGGMICTEDKDFYEWARYARQMGRTAYGAYYDVAMPGWKYNMTGIQAKAALQSLRLLPETLAKAEKQTKLYDKLLKEEPHTSTHLYRIHVPARDSFIKYMKQKGVECSIHFEPIYRKTAYKHLDDGSFKFCDKEYKSTVSLPLHPFLKRSDIEYICDLTTKWRKDWKTLKTILKSKV